MPYAPLVIVNPIAGGGRAARLVPWLRERLAARPEARIIVTGRPGDAETSAAELTEHDRVVAVGGDGTVQEVVNGLRSRAKPAELGIVPVGTGNDLARSLGLPRDPAAAWTIAIGGAVRPVDLAHARNGDGRERWFASAGGIGFDAQVAAAMAARKGWQTSRAGYLMTTLSELRRFSNREARLFLDDETMIASVLFVAIANGAYYGGGMRIAPGARPDDGHLDVCVVGDISRMAALRELRNLYRGTHVRNPAVSMHTARRIRVEADTATPIHLDGEPFGQLPLVVRLEAEALRVAAA